MWRRDIGAQELTYIRIVDADGVVMPVAVAHMGDGPAPLGGHKLIQWGDLVCLLSQQEHQATIVYKQRVVVSVHIYRGK